jgi:protein-L-isoaspartate(D-aspartate) O-methyltransferase
LNPKYTYNDFFKEQRRALVELLRRKGIDDERVLKAMNELPRERFINPSFYNRAYDDNALPIDCNQTISQPYTVAFMTSLLKVKEGDKILEIGTGSGYQACLLYLMGARVFTIERILELYEQSNSIFHDFGYNINIRFGDGTLGWKAFAPFDGIIITAASPKVPVILKEQLAVKGKMVVPVGGKNSQTMFIVERIGEKEYKEYKTDQFKFVPLIGKEGWESE